MSSGPRATTWAGRWYVVSGCDDAVFKAKRAFLAELMKEATSVLNTALPTMPCATVQRPKAEARARLPAGARRRGLADAAERTLGGLFAGRVLPFDSGAARAYADIAAASRDAGHPISQSDCQIAGIARSRGMAMATRNVRDFSDTGVEVIDPWASA